ncbi:hypothetical protein K1719_006875 [Acacia pycnantha]|nr:hypothetical protein K1719_006875 [Acacia pycnantha]
MDSQSEASRMKLQGPRPGPLMLMKNKSSRKMMKKKHVAGQKQSSSPVVIYVKSPKVFHVKPEEFMSLVQQLTGNHNPSSSGTSLGSCETLHRPESEKDGAVGENGQLEHSKCTSTAGPTHALSTNFRTLWTLCELSTTRDPFVV